MARDLDPLGLVVNKAGVFQVDVEREVLAEAKREFEQAYTDGGEVPLAGGALLDRFDRPPYGWNKDVTRYILAALLTAGVIEARAAGETFRTPGPHPCAGTRSPPTEAFWPETCRASTTTCITG